MHKIKISSKSKAAYFLTLSILMFLSMLLGGCKGDVGETFKLTVEMSGVGSGRVSSSPAGIFCETDCLENYNSESIVSLTAIPYSGSIFSGWSGGMCSGTGTCTVSMNNDMLVTANFNLATVEPITLITPYAYEFDMGEVRDIFNAQYSNIPWGQVHDGLDIYPDGDLKPFQAVCTGQVYRIYTLDEQVIMLIACDSNYMAEYNFEGQAPGTGQTQRNNISVVAGQSVSQGHTIGYLYAPNISAHVHLTLYKNGVPKCPAPYFSQQANNSILNLVSVAHQDVTMCLSGDVTPPFLIAPYLNEADMTEIKTGFSSDNSHSPWGGGHDGFDIYPNADLKPFQASCTGTVDKVQLRQDSVDANWEVDVLIVCDNYVVDPDLGGYFIPLSVDYIFETMSQNQTDGLTQFGNISVVEGQTITQGDIVGYLNAVDEESHLHFSLLQYGASEFITYGVTSITLCAETHFSTQAKNSMLNLLHVAWPSANMCYQQ